MKLTAVVLAVFLSAATANASSLNHGGHALTSRHISMARRQASSLENAKPESRTARRRCRPRPSTSAPAAARSSSAARPSSTAKPAEPSPTKANNGGNSGNSGNNNNNKPPPPPPSNNNGGGKMVWSDYCGGSRPSASTTTVSGPNGHIDWLNCGIHNGGWAPPYLRIQDLNIKPLGSALSDPNSPFHACSPFLWAFEQYGNEFGIPAIMLASFAMQESSCRPDTVGGGGEQGLMQITHDKCGGAPGGNCREPAFNIRTGARYFAQTLSANNGDVLISIGQYNGWRRGLTFEAATRARHSACCRCQNNVDYLHQFLNGWLQNINAYNHNLRLGKYFNLDVC